MPPLRSQSVNKLMMARSGNGKLQRNVPPNRWRVTGHAEIEDSFRFADKPSIGRPVASSWAHGNFAKTLRR
jgi:hypothetical protein